MASDEPICSKARLEELGLDPAKYGSCSEQDQRKIQNKGRVWFNRGCKHFYECQWRDSTEHMQAKDEGDRLPRSRNVAIKHIKPNPLGVGDVILNTYAPCHRYHRSFKKRDGQNKEILEVVGGEGNVVNIKSHKKTVNPDGSIYLTPEIKSVTVPRYPDPTEVPELFEDVFAGRERLAHKAKTVDAERQRRLEGASGREDAFEGVTPLEVGPGGTAAQTDKS